MTRRLLRRSAARFDRLERGGNWDATRHPSSRVARARGAGLAAFALVLIVFVAPVWAQQVTSPAVVTGPATSAALPIGTIVAFIPHMGSEYRDLAELRRWLDQQGWAICDGSRGTPDLRDRMLLGTVDADRTGERLGSWEHEHRIRGETGIPARRNRDTPTGRLQLRQIPDDQHKHRLDMKSDKVEHLPPSVRVLFIMKLR